MNSRLVRQNYSRGGGATVLMCGRVKGLRQNLMGAFNFRPS